MGLLPTILKLIDVPLYGFSGHSIQPSGGVKLLVTTGNHPTQATVLNNFLVVDTLGVYNAIIGKPTLNTLQAVASTYHLALKFTTPTRVGVVHENQVEVRHCYALALKGQPNTRQKTNRRPWTSPRSRSRGGPRSPFHNNFTQTSLADLKSPTHVITSSTPIEADSIKRCTQLGKASRGH